MPFITSFTTAEREQSEGKREDRKCERMEMSKEKKVFSYGTEIEIKRLNVLLF